MSINFGSLTEEELLGMLLEKNDSVDKKKDFEEMVDHPSHYNNGIEVIDYIESHDFNFNLGNAIKYISRCEYKGTKSQDIEKAIWYLNRELSKGE